MKKISLCLIVKNEENVLARCINSMKGCYDELIIVDTGSTDKTVEIAKELGARVEHFEWIDDFSAARNYTMSFATGDWIMWVDADDIIEEGKQEEFRKIVHYYDDNENVIGLNFPYIYSHESVGTGEIPNFKYHRLRIFKTGFGVWRARIHEYIPMDGNKTVNINHINFHHYRDEGKGTQNTARNLRILQKVVDEATPEEKPRYLFYYGKECMYNNLYDEAEKAFLQYIPISNWVPEKHRAMYELSVCYQIQGKLDLAKEYACKAIALNEDYVDPYVLMGIFAYNEKRWKDVIKWMSSAITCSPPVTLFFDYVPYLTYVPHDYMSIAHWNLGQYEKAHASVVKALSYKPNDGRFLYNKKMFEDKLGATTTMEAWVPFIDYHVKSSVELVKDKLQDIKTMVDVGANVGSFVMNCLEINPELTIAMYEPVKKYYDVCVERFDIKNVEVYNFGLSDKNEELIIYKDKDNLGVNTIYKPENLTKFEEEQIALRVFDEVNTFDKVDLIKIDVEGAEYLVLEGMKNTIIKDKPIIIVENGWHRDDEKLLAKVREKYEWLFYNGYKRFNYDMSKYEDLVFIPE